MSNRSGSPYSIPRDSNRVPAMGGVLASDGVTVKPVEIDSNGNLLVNTAANSNTQAIRTDSATTPNVTYVGKAAIGTATSAASWQIFKMDETVTNTLTITWAGGASSFNQVWDNRTSLTYS